MNTKKIASIVAMVLGIGMIAGCTQTATTGNDKDDQGRTVISVGHWPAKEGAALTKSNQQKEEYEAENPQYAITPDTWSFDIQTFYSKAAAGQLPTVYYAYFTEIEKIIDNGYCADITEGLKRAGYDGVYNEAVLDIISKNGKIYAYPTDSYSLGLVYNVDLFEKAGLMNEDGTPQQPKDWDEVVEFGLKIKQATGKAGFVIPTIANQGGWMFTPMAWSFGVNFMSEKDGKYTATFDSQEMVDALQYISDLKWKHNIFLDNALIDSDEYYKQFALGNIGMIIAPPNSTDTLKKYEMPIENIGMMPMPEGPAKHITLTGGYTALVANGATEDQIDAAIKWLEKVGYGFALTEESKLTIEDNYKKDVSDNVPVGIAQLSVYKDDTQIRAFSNQMREKYANINLNHVKLYNESLTDTSIELKPEEPVCAQELYAVLDGLIQEVLTNQNANIKALVSTANSEFQSNYLNNLD